MGVESDKARYAFIFRNRYLLIILLAGVVLILLPGGGSDDEPGASTKAEQRLQGALQSMEGVGNAYVLLAEEEGRNQGYRGAIILCDGADTAEVRLRIVEAVSAFAGLDSNRIIVLKMKN